MRRILMLSAILIALPGAMCSTTDPVKPERHRYTPVPLPTQPAGEALCDDDADGEPEPCLSQAQSDLLFNNTIDALCIANNKLAWLHDYFEGTTLPPICGAERD